MSQQMSARKRTRAASATEKTETPITVDDSESEASPLRKTPKHEKNEPARQSMPTASEEPESADQEEVEMDQDEDQEDQEDQEEQEEQDYVRFFE